jgi:hypothetical protein
LRGARHKSAIAWRCFPSCDLVVETRFIQVSALPVFDIENIQDSPAAGDNDVPQAAIDLIKEFEGLYLNAYNDPKTGGKPITIGWGSTKTLTGGEWKLGDSITKAQAEELLKHEILRRTLPGCKKIPTWNQMNDNQKGAIIRYLAPPGGGKEGGWLAQNRPMLARSASGVKAWPSPNDGCT